MPSSRAPICLKPLRPTTRLDQVRIPSYTVHRLLNAATAPDGRVYRTLCGLVLTAARGAVITSVEVGCCQCEEAEKPTRAEILAGAR